MKPIHVGPDLLDLLAAATESMGPVLCRHWPGAGDGWTLEVNPESAHVGRWVHADAGCRLPSYEEN